MSFFFKDEETSFSGTRVLFTKLHDVILVNNQLDAQFFFMYVYFYSLHVSGSHVPIIRRTNYISTTSGICHPVQMAVWCAGLDETAGVQVWIRLLCSLIQTCTQNGHLYRVSYTRCRIDTISSPNDGHMAAQNMHRIEINIHEKELFVKLVIYKDYTEMHDQQDVKL